jgi:hypothetical protein
MDHVVPIERRRQTVIYSSSVSGQKSPALSIAFDWIRCFNSGKKTAHVSVRACNRNSPKEWCREIPEETAAIYTGNMLSWKSFSIQPDNRTAKNEVTLDHIQIPLAIPQSSPMLSTRVAQVSKLHNSVAEPSINLLLLIFSFRLKTSR